MVHASSLGAGLPIVRASPDLWTSASTDVWKDPKPPLRAFILSCSGEGTHNAGSVHRLEGKFGAGEIFGDHPEPLRHLHIGRGGGAAHERRIATRPWR